MFIDTHCHISKKYYDNIDLVINDSMKNNVKLMIFSCCEKEDIDESIQLLNSYDCLFATFGFHPDQIDEVCDEDLDQLEKIITKNKKIIGIGEIGLDYHYPTDKEKQKKLFKKQLSMAQRLNLPVVIHSRDATKDTIDILSQYYLKGIIHCFSGSIETAKTFIKMGYKLGIGGVLTFKNSKLDHVVKKLSIKNIVLETDSPYLTPHPFRGEKNSSKYIPLIAQKLSELQNIPVEDVEKITSNNCYELFDLNL